VHTVSNTENYLGSHILWELDMIRFTGAPLSVTDCTENFVRTMEDTVSSVGQPLFKFLLGLPLYSLRDGMIRLLLNAEAMPLFMQHEQLTIQKEDAVVEQQFDLAAQKRDAQYELMAKLNHLVAGPIAILPEHVIKLIRDLGFDGALPRPT
jgi:hypothetical protein